MQWLSKRIAAIHRTDVDRDFLAVLAKRMTASRGIAELDRALQFQCRHSFRQRDILIRALCRQIRDLIQEGHAKVQHPILGEIEVPRIGGSRSEIAAIMTNDVFVRRLKIRVPSVSTIQKIAGM